MGHRETCRASRLELEAIREGEAKFGSFGGSETTVGEGDRVIEWFVRHGLGGRAQAHGEVRSERREGSDREGRLIVAFVDFRDGCRGVHAGGPCGKYESSRGVRGHCQRKDGGCGGCEGSVAERDRWTNSLDGESRCAGRDESETGRQLDGSLDAAGGCAALIQDTDLVLERCTDIGARRTAHCDREIRCGDGSGSQSAEDRIG